MIFHPTNRRRDGLGAWDSLGERALVSEAVQCEADEIRRAEARLNAWTARHGS